MKVALSIEIGNEHLKIAVAKAKGPQGKILEWIIQPIASYADVDISAAVIAHLRQRKYRADSVTVSLPRNFVTMRNLHLPSTDKEEIEKMIGIHVTRIVPHKLEEVVSSYCLSGIDEMGYGRVLLAIVHNEIISRQMKILDKAGFLVEEISLSSYCIWNHIIKEFRPAITQTGLYGILDVDTDYTDFILFERDNLLFTRTIAVKSKEINTELGMKKLIGETKQLIVIFNNEEVSSKPQKIFLSGAIEPEMAKLVSQDLDIPVQSISVAKAEAVKEQSPDMKNCSLMAVSHMLLSSDSDKKLSFILPEMKIRKSLRERFRELSVLGSLTVYTLCVICLIFLGKIYNQQLYLNRLTDRSIQIEKETGGLPEQIEKVNFVKNYLYERQLPLVTLSPLQKQIKENTALTFIRINEDNKIVVRGRVFQLSDVFDLVGDLEKNPYFDDVQTHYTRKQKYQGQEITDFEISFLVTISKTPQ